MLYRIITDDYNRELIESIMLSKFADFTILTAIGIWKNKKERSLIIEIETAAKNEGEIKLVASTIKQVNGQMAVMLQKIRNDTKLLWKER